MFIAARYKEDPDPEGVTFLKTTFKFEARSWKIEKDDSRPGVESRIRRIRMFIAARYKEDPDPEEVAFLKTTFKFEARSWKLEKDDPRPGSNPESEGFACL